MNIVVYNMAMRFSELDDSQQTLIRAYEPGCVRINNKQFTHSIIISAGQIQPWDIQTADNIEAEAILDAISPTTEVLLIGTGSQQQILSTTLLKHFLLKGIGVEVMGSAAASRTYNILLSEGRQVAVALIVP
ncbi:MAG: hypothetical protein GXP22_01405 [Gammaproteobacteria bacterium]|nr:hypothetical protein [Gammaproteobacteria bacterium]